MKTMEIKLAHSPDSDDAFMFYALATNRVKAPGLKFTHVLSDIETLNHAADQETYDVTAISFSAYAYLHDKYVLLDCGASFGDGYGPDRRRQQAHEARRPDRAPHRRPGPAHHFLPGPAPLRAAIRGGRRSLRPDYRRRASRHRGRRPADPRRPVAVPATGPAQGGRPGPVVAGDHETACCRSAATPSAAPWASRPASKSRAPFAKASPTGWNIAKKR